jgi:hypothetical protein
MDVPFSLQTLKLFLFDRLDYGFEGLDRLKSPFRTEDTCQNLQKSQENKAARVEFQGMNIAILVKKCYIMPRKHNKDKECITHNAYPVKESPGIT